MEACRTAPVYAGAVFPKKIKKTNTEEPMKKGEVYEGIIEKIEFPNKGLVHLEDTKVVVKNGIPGQKVRFQINKKRGKKLEGRLLEVLEKSPKETREPVCSLFPDCGGCMYQTMDYPAQLQMKETQVRELLEPVMVESGQYRMEGEQKIADYQWDGIFGSPIEFAYRNKMEFSFGDAVKGGPLTLGLHKKGSTYDVLTASDCKLVHRDMTKILECVLEYFEELKAPYYHKMQHVGYLRHLLLRRGVTTGEILVNLVTTTQEEYDLEPLKERLLALPLEGTIVGFLHVLNDSLSDTVQSDRTEIIWGQDHFYETLLGLRFKITPFSFFQPNSKAAEVLYTKVREYLGDTSGQTVFDLYSGTGTIAQLAAAVADEVIGVEIVEEAVVAARENAARNGLSNCKFLAGDVLKVIDELEEKPDTIILDPPRDGIHPKALPKILAFGVNHIVYISCKATSLARDLPAFLQAGYRVERALAVDQFSQTVHVETVCLLSKLHEAKHHVNVKVDMDELDLTSAEAKATYKEIEEWVQEHYGFHVTNLNIAQVKQKHGIIERENYNKPKSENSRQPGTTPEKERAITETLKFFKMI